MVNVAVDTVEVVLTGDVLMAVVCDIYLSKCSVDLSFDSRIILNFFCFETANFRIIQTYFIYLKSLLHTNCLKDVTSTAFSVSCFTAGHSYTVMTLSIFPLYS